MTELWATGWVHDRIRVVVSSFFVKVLQLPWRWGMKYFWDTLLDADLESDALAWQYISGTLPDGRELDHIDNPECEGYKFDPKGEYVRRWLPELARLPTEWIHHPWDAPGSVLQAAGVELGSNYPLPIVQISTAKDRLQEALSEMWHREAASRAAMENGTQEGLGDSTEPTQEESDATIALRRTRQADQMVPTITASNADRNSDNMNQVRFTLVLSNHLPNGLTVAASTSSTVGSRGGGGTVPVWPPTNSSHSEQFLGEDAGLGSSSSYYYSRHAQPHQIMNCRQLSQMG